MLHRLIYVLSQKSPAYVLSAVAVPEKYKVHSVTFRRRLERNHFIFGIFRIILPDGESGSVVLVLEFEDHAPLAGLAGRHLLECQLQLCLALARCPVKDDPFGLLLDKPVLVRAERNFPRDRSIERGCHSRPYGKIAVGRHSLEVLPSCRHAVLNDGGFGHFHREIVFRNARESLRPDCRRYVALADDAVQTEAVLERPALGIAGIRQDGFQIGGQDNPLQASASGEGPHTDAVYVLRKFEYAGKAGVVGENPVAYSPQIRREHKFPGKIAAVEAMLAERSQTFREHEFATELGARECIAFNGNQSVIEDEIPVQTGVREASHRNDVHALRNHERTAQVAAVRERILAYIFQIFRQMKFAIESRATQERALADFLERIRKLELAGEIAAGEDTVPISGVSHITAYPFERTRQIQAAAQTRAAPECRLVYEFKPLRESQRTGERIAVAERGFVDALQPVGEYD